MNLGPTGIRAKIDPDLPKTFKVMFVFQDSKSPAKGKVKIGDHIIGANGKPFKDPHRFHRKKGGRGWPGPPYELAHAIEDSQGRDGKLDLMIHEGGNKSKAKTVTIQLDAVGRFADTWPWDCPRSNRLRQDLCDFLIEQPRKGRIHVRAQYILAMYASGDKRAVPLFKQMGESLARGRPQATAGGMCTWGWGYTGIFLGEYYNVTKDKNVLPAVQALLDCYQHGQTYGNGGFSHRPYPAITKRIASGGPKGYGPMAGPGGLSMLAQSIFKATGLPVNEQSYNQTHYAFLRTCGGNESGTLAYGFRGSSKTWHIRLKNATSPCKSQRGIGFECPTGLENAGPFEVEDWKQKPDGTWEMNLVASSRFPDIRANAPGLKVFDEGENRRAVVIPTVPDEPTKPYNNNHKGGGHNAPVGMGALSHYIGNQGNTSWNHLGKHMATGCAYSPHTLWDGHASGEMHAFWAALGASRADEKDFRYFLDYTKTWIILSESHDGEGLIDQPFGCQRNSTCSIALNRTAYTHVALMILGIPNRNLLITGADYDQPAPMMASTGGSRTGKPSRKPQVMSRSILTPKTRSMPSEKKEILDRALHRTIEAVCKKETLKTVPLSLSVATQKMWLSGIDDKRRLMFRELTEDKQMEFEWEDFTDDDKALLAKLVAAYVNDSTDAQAMAGAYMEIVGDFYGARKFYSKSDNDSRKKFNALFGDTGGSGPAARPTWEAPKISSSNKAKLDSALKRTLVAVGERETLRAVPLNLSVTSRKVWLSSAGDDGTLTLVAMDGKSRQKVKWDRFDDRDKATLARLVAAYANSSPDAQAMAGSFMRLISDQNNAERFFAKSTVESRNKFGKLFDDFKPEMTLTRKPPSRPAPPSHPTLAPAKKKVLDRALLRTIANVSEKQEMKPVPLSLSVSISRVWVASVKPDGTVTLQNMGADDRKDYRWEDFTDRDRATFAKLLAAYETESSDAQAMAGVYLEITGQKSVADSYYARSDEDSRRKFKSLLQN